MERVLILGARGTLGAALHKLYPSATALDREDLDVLDAPATETLIRSLSPSLILNCVAYNDVDGAEDDPSAAFALNASFPARLAALARDLPAALVHYSTNYVFPGRAADYVESDATHPLSVYGHSKLEGEQGVLRTCPSALVLRTSVIFGVKGPSPASKRSFVDLMLELTHARTEVSAVVDEVNSVTYAPDLAAATRTLIDATASGGVYHAANSGSASWCDMAEEIVRLTGAACTVRPVPAASFPRKARRPSRAVLANTRFPPLRPWREALGDFLRSRPSAEGANERGAAIPRG